MTSGWICPKCGRVYAPFQAQCLFCNDAGSYHDKTTIDYGYKKPTTDATFQVVCDYCHKDCSSIYHTTEIRTDGNHRRMCVDCWNTRDRGN